MQASVVFWAWVTAAVILAFAEVLSGGFLTLPFGIGAAVAACLELVGAAVGWQWVVFVGLSSVLLVVLQRIAAHGPEEPRGGTPDA